ncbi:tol-pal system protein YbgF [Henriciella sp. AS95]|uniref:tol-pal system protein YbgF n=1 Tax=Henriciella sp. AS95 TaxID=3135782 RepID=UPI00317B804B
MNRLAFACSLLAMSCTLVPVASAQQGAPIVRGATSGNLADAVQDVRQQNAQLKLSISRLEDRNAQLNGKIETLEFLLSQSRDEMNRMQNDDAQIAEELESLRSANASLNSRLQDLEGDIQAIMSTGLTEEGSEAVVAARSTPPEISDDDRAQVASTSSLGSETRRIITRSTNAGEISGNPGQQGSLGTLMASDLPGEAGPLFATAKSRLLKFQYEEAEQAFRAFLDRFGDDPQAGEAQYWLAETLFQQEAFAESGQAYTQMIRDYPDNARAPDALVKLARSMRLVGDTEKACNALAILPEQYPNASGVTRNLAALESTRSGCDT